MPGQGDLVFVAGQGQADGSADLSQANDGDVHSHTNSFASPGSIRFIGGVQVSQQPVFLAGSVAGQ